MLVSRPLTTWIDSRRLRTGEMGLVVTERGPPEVKGGFGHIRRLTLRRRMRAEPFETSFRRFEPGIQRRERRKPRLDVLRRNRELRTLVRSFLYDWVRLWVRVGLSV